MKHRFHMTATLIVIVISLTSAVAVASEPWLLGVWTAVSDEDATPPDVIEFFPDGVHINYGVRCGARSEMSYHIHNGDVYVTGEIPNKGPVAIIFRPTLDRKQLTFTSPRTRNNATYERLPANPCHK